MILLEKYKSLLDRYKNSNSFRRVSLNIGWLLFDKIIRLGVGLLVSVWVARYLGPEQFGKWNYAIALVAIYSAFAVLGLDSIVIKKLVNEPEHANVLLGSSFLIRIIGGIFTVFISVLTVILLNENDRLLLIIIILTSSSLIFQAFDVLDYYFQSKVESKYTVYAKNSAFILVSLTKIILILINAELIAFVWVSFFEVVIGSLLMIVFFYWSKNQLLRNWRVSKRVSKELLKESFPLLLSGIVGIIYMRIDQVMLKQLDGDRSVGIYSAAVKVAEVWYFIPAVLTSSVYPSLIELKKINKFLFLKRIKGVYDILAFLSISISLITTFFSGYIMRFLYGGAYTGGAPILSLTMWAGVFVFLGVANNQYLIIEDERKILFYKTLIGAFTNVILNIFLIPLYQGVGAAIATLISYGISVLGVGFFKRTRMHARLLVGSLNPFTLIKRNNFLF